MPSAHRATRSEGPHPDQIVAVPDVLRDVDEDALIEVIDASA